MTVSNYEDVEPVSATSEKQNGVADGGKKPGGATYVRLSTADIFSPIPPTSWVVESLQLTHGRPNLLIAPGGIGKSIVAQSIAVSIASTNLRLWQQFAVRHGRVLHIDHDQGGGATKKRYQRLVPGMGITVADLGGRLEAIIRPPFYLNARGSEDAYLRECDGVDFCIIDAFRGANPGIDENDSRVRDGLDMLARVSEKTQTTFLVLHHSGKTQPGETAGRSASRGSSAIDDGSGAQIVLTGEKGKPKLVRIVRDSQDYDGGQTTEPFYLEFVDVPLTGQQRPGLRVNYKTREQVEGGPSSPEREFDMVVSAVRNCIAQHPGIPGKGAVRELLGIGREKVSAAVDTLMANSEVEDRGQKGRGGNSVRLYTCDA